MKQAPQQIIYELCIMSPPTVKSDGSQPIEPRKRPGEGSRQGSANYCVMSCKIVTLGQEMGSAFIPLELSSGVFSGLRAVLVGRFRSEPST